VASIDAYRGFVMFLMMAEVLHLPRVAAAVPESGFWKFLAWHQTHVEWFGCTLHDLIQPSFSFLVGVALPFSIASRVARGQTQGKMIGHALWRALILVFLGVFLRSVGRSQTNFTFEDTLSQIGLGYGFLFVCGLRSVKTQWIVLGSVLIGCWLAFALYPVPGPDFDYARVGVPPDWAYHATGLAAHWNKNSNLAWAFDTWFLNLFPREREFLFNGGGYATLSFVPTLGTMLLGLIAGGWLRRPHGATDARVRFCIAGLALLAAGWLVHKTGLCPSVKRIWTPAWVLFSGGWCFLLLGAFHAVLDLARTRSWAFPLMVIGANSIAAYCMAHLIDTFIISSLRTHLGRSAFAMFGNAYEPLLTGGGVLLVLWLILFWMYRRRIFLRI
jgi:predicted acyltransferase